MGFENLNGYYFKRPKSIGTPLSKFRETTKEQKKSNLKRHHMLYRRLQYHKVHQLDGSYEPPVYKSLQSGNQRPFWPRFQLCARRDWFDAILKSSGQRRRLDRLAKRIRIARKHPRRLLSLGGGRGYSLEFLVRVCRPHLQIQTQFQTKMPFPIPVFRPDLVRD